MKFAHLQFTVLALSLFVSNAYAQPEVVTPQLIDQYQLDLSQRPITPESLPRERYRLQIGANWMINNGFDVSIGALYLRDYKTNTYELISRTLSNSPAIVYRDSANKDNISADFEKIVYVSNDANIVAGDEPGTYDVFIYTRSTGLTERIQGSRPHQGDISHSAISPDGMKVAFTSRDLEFGSTPVFKNPGYSFRSKLAVYIYDLQTRDLPYPISDEIGYQILNENAFSPDSTLLFFSENTEEDGGNIVFYYTQLFAYELENKNVIDIAPGNNGSFSGDSYFVDNIAIFPRVKNSGYSYTHGSIDVFDLSAKINVSNPMDDVWQQYVGSSVNGRYAMFTSSRTNDPADAQTRILDGGINYDNTSGHLWIMDTQTRQWRQAMDVQKTSLGFYKYQAAPVDRDAYLSYIYIADDEFYNAVYYGNDDTIIGNTYDSGCCYGGSQDIIANSEPAYQISPTDLRFHNNNRYITFEGNSWYLDETIAYDDFEIPYARNTFVMANPFADDSINIDGAPFVDRATETGLYVWRNPNGQMVVKAVAGNSAQNGESTLFSGTITSGSVITGLVEFSIEANDTVSQSGIDRIDFALKVRSPWEDRIVFMADSTQSLCIDLTAFAGGLFLGPDKVSIDTPYDVINQSQCETPDIVVEGKPSIDRAIDQGWFIWRDNGVWYSEFVAGGTTYIYQGGIQSDQALSNVAPVSHETDGSDTLTKSANALSFELLVTGPWYDGLQFSNSGTASSCVYLSDPANVNIYIGPNRVAMPNGFDLNTLKACQPTPQLETEGKPTIEQSTDKGIFLWTKGSNNWVAHVVSGNRPRTVGIDVASDQAITNVVHLSIEASDVFNVSPNKLFMRLNIMSPWMDGFKFSVNSDSTSCVSTRNPGVPIYVGPNRVELGSSVDLTTLMNCP